ncbi:restriction endonuclease subunit S [Vibrio alginolyticus]|nr:restriction endonuclease subunit S [Vibrio alginolyticus]
MTDKQTVKFGDICKEVKLTTKDPIGDGYERYIGLEHLDSGSLKIKRWGMIAEDNPSFTRVFKKGHILFGKRRPYLKKAAIAEFDGVCSSDIIVMEATNNLQNKSLLPHLVQSQAFWDLAVKTSSGSLSPRTKFKSLSVFEVPKSFDSLTKKKLLEQIYNVNLKSIALQESAIRLRDNFLANILTNGIGANSLRKEKWFSMPSDWDLVTVDDIATKVTDGDHHTPKRSDTGVLLLSARNVLNGKLSFDDVDYVPESEYERMIKRCHPEPDDLLISCSGTIGRISLVPENARFALVRSVALVKFDKSKVFPKYLEWVFRSKQVQRQIAVEQLAAAQPNLFQGSIKRLCFPCPDYVTQQKIANTMDELDKLTVPLLLKEQGLERVKEVILSD